MRYLTTLFLTVFAVLQLFANNPSDGKANRLKTFDFLTDGRNGFTFTHSLL